jgi:hypothetical protein
LAAVVLVTAGVCWANPGEDLLKNLQVLDAYETPEAVKHEALDRLSAQAERNELICTELVRRLGATDGVGYRILEMYSAGSDHVCRKRVFEVLAVASSRDMWPIMNQLSAADLTNSPEQVRIILLQGDRSLAAALAWHIGRLGLVEFRDVIARAVSERRYASDEEVKLQDGHVREWGLVYAIVLTGLSRTDGPSQPSGTVPPALRFLREWLDHRRSDYCDEEGCDLWFQNAWESIERELTGEARSEKEQ